MTDESSWANYGCFRGLGQLLTLQTLQSLKTLEVICYQSNFERFCEEVEVITADPVQIQRLSVSITIKDRYSWSLREILNLYARLAIALVNREVWHSLEIVSLLIRIQTRAIPSGAKDFNDVKLVLRSALEPLSKAGVALELDAVSFS